jgi:hypothetical protein
MGAASEPEPLPRWMQQLADEVAADEERQRRKAAEAASSGSSSSSSSSSDREVPTAFMAVWGGACAVSLGAGVTVGYRGFENTAAFEALDKMEKPTAASEAMASRMAMRAFGWGTALCLGTAATVVAACQACGIRSAADVGTVSRAYLVPFDAWLRARGDWMIAVGAAAGAGLDGLCEGTARHWHSSWLANSIRGRVERVSAHHEQLEEKEAQQQAVAAAAAAATGGSGETTASGAR